jgi:anthranilate synthase component I
MPAAAEPLGAASAPTLGLQIDPGLERARELAGEHAGDGERYNLIPLRHSFIDDCETPVSAFLKLRAIAPEEPSFLLESADQGQRVGRWSFIGFRPRAVLRWSLASAPAGEDPYALVAEYVGRFRQAPMSDAESGAGGASAGGLSAGGLSVDGPGVDGPGVGGPGVDGPGVDGLGVSAPPFSGGAVGFFGYDLVRTVEPLGEPNPDPLGLPDMALMLSDALVVFDHLKHTVTILANADLAREPDVERAYAAAARTIVEIRERLAGPVPRAEPAPEGSGAPVREMPQFESNMPREQFEGMVERIVEYIYAGDAFQVVPSQRWSAPVPVEAFSIYRGLRTVNPSPYMYFLDFVDFQVAGASPEPLLTVSGGQTELGPAGRVSTRPIAGTRPRGGSAEEDERIARELLEDEKERAEHVMLVDLGRNDLGRVCEAGSVEVETFMAVETYSHVMHIVSSVAGRLRGDVTPMDALRSVLPAGTLSGAPKVRAMQIIDELEPIKRGGYGGAIGYLSYAGDLDTCIHIRTVVVKDGVAHIQAGGGTVADAKPAYEYEESRAKSRAVLRAIELAIAQPEWP